VFILYNTAGLIALGIKGAGRGRVVIAQKIHEFYHDKPVNLICLAGRSPYIEWKQGPKNTFYLSNGKLSIIDLNYRSKLSDYMKKGYFNLLLFLALI